MNLLEAKHNAGLKLLTSVRDVVNFLTDKIDTDDLSKSVSKVEKMASSKVTENLSTYYSDISKLLHAIAEVINKISDVKLSSIDASDTYKIDAGNMISKLRSKHAAFVRDTQQTDLEIIPELTESIVKSIIDNYDEKKVLEIREMYHTNRSAVSLYANTMQRLIDHYYQSDKSIAFKLMSFIEEDKTLALQTDTKDFFKNRSRIAGNPPQHRFGLVPVTPSMEMKELLDVILAEETTPINTTSIPKLSKLLKAGFIVFNHIVPTPIEYDIRPLIVPEAAAPFVQPATAGITKKTIERFTTIKALDSGKKWDFSVEIHGDDFAKFYVIETLDGKNYRSLAPWVHSTKYSLARFRVSGILSHNPKKPSRAMNYHMQASKQAVNNMFLGKSINLEDFEKKHVDIESGRIHDSILEHVFDVTRKLCRSEYSDDFKSSTIISDILHNKKLLDAFNDVTITHYATKPSCIDKGAINNMDGGKFPHSEILASFIVDLQTAKRRFARELHNGYSRDPLGDDFADKSKTERLKIGLEKIQAVIRQAIELVIKLDDNIYTTAYFKWLILNFAV